MLVAVSRGEEGECGVFRSIETERGFHLTASTFRSCSWQQLEEATANQDLRKCDVGVLAKFRDYE